ncbi:ABC transporter substrate-binding protein [Bradyrhizobium sp. Tv2a-2]|uniref:ABC transporter substrate-binding protein n=1 Tax=Bradyrhizobium sp. Tv2a-2 TaxID=113395 RepID=UPI00046717A3|nr:ABC transporter substrate-binding protein [Bradyrhizobium sp. Tv2a-2]
MDRRRFFALLGVPLLLPLKSVAQQVASIRRVGILLPAKIEDAEYPTLIKAFIDGMRQAGWTEGVNLRLDIRWSGGSVDGIAKNAAELAALAPEVIVTAGATATGPLLQLTRNIPVVFTIVPDPVGAGFIDSLARPGGNATGVASFEYTIGGKWVDLLKEVLPHLKRVAVLRDPQTTAGIGQFQAVQSATTSAGLEIRPVNMHDATAIERETSAFATSGGGGLIVTSSGLSVMHRDLIVSLAERFRLPAVYYAAAFARAGGLIAYGSDRKAEFRRAASYVDRILKGTRPEEIPTETPTKYELVVNTKAAKMIGLNIPTSMLARADEVIE